MEKERAGGGARVYDPRGVVSAEPRPLAARASTLAAKRIAVLDNSKWNAGKLLRRISDKLSHSHDGLTFTYYVKESFSKAAPDNLLDQIAADNDLVLTAIGD